jgi:2-dehydro-3-deoxyphosphogalactonate aldolase
MAMPTLRQALKQCPIVAILRGVKPDEIVAIGDALVEAGITIIEVPLNSPQPFDSIVRLSARHGGRTLIGAGTVLDPADVTLVKDAGGQLVVAPNFDADVVRAAKAAGVAALPGVMTPSEGFAALKAGADGLKLFPSEIIPPVAFKAWRAVFEPDTLMFAVGGVGVDNIRSYAEAGASGYGIGSALYKPERPVEEIGRLAKAMVAAVKVSGSRPEA